jgi:hypothetical protein
VTRRRHLLGCCLCVVLAVAVLAAPARGTAQSQTPSETFQAYRKALAAATSFADVSPFMDSKARTTIEALPEKQRSAMFDLLKKFDGIFTDVTVTKETVEGDTAVLALSGKDPKGQPATGSIPLVKEADGWKVGTERWSSAPR